MDIANFWNLSPEEQDQIKAAHPVDSQYRYTITGRIGIFHSNTMTSFQTTLTVIAATAAKAKDKAAAEWAAQYNGVTNFGWVAPPKAKRGAKV